jgi:membrane protein required for colicin V production
MEEAQAVAHHSNGLNWVDIVVILLMLGSGLFAMMRGFVKEGFVLLSLICGAIVATRFYPMLQPWMRDQISSRVTADICTWLILFISTLILFIPISSFVVGKVQGQAMTTIDRSLGFVFGAVRGALIACLLYLMLAQFWDKPKDAPYWIKEAKTTPLLVAGADMIKELVPIQGQKKKKKNEDGTDSEETEEEDTSNSNDEEPKRGEKLRKAEDFLRNLTRPEPELNKNQPAYDEKARQHLNDLIEKKSSQ